MLIGEIPKQIWTEQLFFSSKRREILMNWGKIWYFIVPISNLIPGICGQIDGLKLISIFRRTTERITELRDLFDELDDLIRKVKRHQAHMGVSSDEKTKKMLRTSIKNVVRNISYLSNSVSLKNNTNKGPIQFSDNLLAISCMQLIPCKEVDLRSWLEPELWKSFESKKSSNLSYTEQRVL